jgi:GAF domain-containing protein
VQRTQLLGKELIVSPTSSGGLWEMSAEPMATESLGVNELLTELAILATCPEGGGGPSCGIVLLVSGLPSAVACSDETAARMEAIQQETRDGPCVTAIRTGQVASVEDTALGGQWAEFGARAAAEGVGSSLSVPLAVDNSRVGALNLYAPGAGAFGETRLRWARGVAAAVSGVLELAAGRAEQARQVEDLRAALIARAVIDQALGIIMAQQRCTSDEAFDILRRASQSRNVKLRDVAAGLVTGISGRPPRRSSFRHRSLDD